MSKTKIEWTETTWNPVTGCTKISQGCQNCYAERMAKRLQAMGVKNYKKGFQLTCHPHLIDKPLEWKKGKNVFVNSMSDLFHEEVSDDFIHQIFKTMRLANQHTFQILTKRSSRLLEISQHISWPQNVWMGVTVESADCSYRIDDLRETSASVKFLSIEPLLGPMPNLNLESIDWVIVGGESGPKARPIKKGWVADVRNQCVSLKIPFFFKQWGGVNKKKTGRILEGRTWDERPPEWSNNRIKPDNSPCGSVAVYA